MNVDAVKNGLSWVSLALVLLYGGCLIKWTHGIFEFETDSYLGGTGAFSPPMGYCVLGIAAVVGGNIMDPAAWARMDLDKVNPVVRAVFVPCSIGVDKLAFTQDAARHVHFFTTINVYFVVVVVFGCLCTVVGVIVGLFRKRVISAALCSVGFVCMTVGMVVSNAKPNEGFIASTSMIIEMLVLAILTSGDNLEKVIAFVQSLAGKTDSSSTTKSKRSTKGRKATKSRELSEEPEERRSVRSRRSQSVGVKAEESVATPASKRREVKPKSTSKVTKRSSARSSD